MSGKNANITKNPLRPVTEKRRPCKAGYANVIDGCNNIWRVSCALLMSVLWIGCTGAAPEIIEVKNTLVYRYESQRSFFTEELSLFARISDDDGIDDIQYVYLIHEDLELYWTLTPQNWSRLTHDEAEWIGSRTLRMANDAYMPRGRFRLEVVDYGGKRDMTSISIPQSLPIDQITDSVPDLQIREGLLYLISPHADNVVYQRLPGGEVEQIYAGAAGTIESDIVFERDDAEAVGAEYWLYSFLDDDEALILRGPVEPTP